MNSSFCVYAYEADSFPLKYSLAQLLGNSQSCDKHCSTVLVTDGFETLSYSANDVITWRLDLDGYSFAIGPDHQTI